MLPDSKLVIDVRWEVIDCNCASEIGDDASSIILTLFS